MPTQHNDYIAEKQFDLDKTDRHLWTVAQDITRE